MVERSEEVLQGDNRASCQLMRTGGGTIVDVSETGQLGTCQR